MAAAEEGPGPEIGCTGARFGVASRRRRIAPEPVPRDPITEVIPALPEDPAPAESGRDPDDVPDGPVMDAPGPVRRGGAPTP